MISECFGGREMMSLEIDFMDVSDSSFYTVAPLGLIAEGVY